MIYFLHGDIPLQLKLEELVDKIKKENPGIPEKHYDINQDNIDDIFLTLSTDSMFIPKSLIIIKRMETLKKIKPFIKSLGEFNFSKKIVILVYEELLNDYGKATNEVTADTMKRIAPIAKVISARNKDEKKALFFFVQKELECSDYEANKFLEMIGEDVYKIKNEIIKVQNFLNGEKFSLEKVEHILSVSEKYNLKTLTEDFLLHKEKDKLIAYLRKEKNYLLFLFVLTDELGHLYKLKSLEKLGVVNYSMSYNFFNDTTYPKIREYFINEKLYFVNSSARYLKSFVIFLKLRYLKLYSMEKIQKSLKEALLAEHSIKSGKIDQENAIERFIVSFCTQ